MPTTNTFVINPNGGYVIAASQFTDITAANGNLPTGVIYSSVVFTDTGTPNTSTNTVLATVTWVADASYDGTGSPITLPIDVNIENLIPYYVKVRVLPKYLPTVYNYNNQVLPSVQFSGLDSQLSLTNLTGAIVPYSYPPQEFVIQGVIPAETNNYHFATLNISSDSVTPENLFFGAVGAGVNFSFDGDLAASESDYSTPLTQNNNGTISIDLKFNSGSSSVVASDEHIIEIEPDFANASLNIISESGAYINHRYLPTQGGSMTLGVEAINCSLQNATITNDSPSDFVTTVIGDNQIVLNFGENATGTSNTAQLNAFANLSPNSPASFVNLTQSADNEVIIKAAFNKSLMGVVDYGYEYPYTNGSNTIALPKVPGAGLTDMALFLYVDTANSFYSDLFDSYPLWASTGPDSNNITYQGVTTFGYIDIAYTDPNNAGWLEVSNILSQDSFEEVAVLPYNLKVNGNFSGSERSATITLHHPLQTTTDSIVITQRKAFDPTTDTVDFMFNDAQSYSVPIDNSNLPINGTSTSLINVSSTGNESGIAVLIDSANLPPAVFDAGDEIYQETGAVALPIIEVGLSNNVNAGELQPAISSNPIILNEDNGTHTYDYWFLLEIYPNEGSYYSSSANVMRECLLSAKHPNHTAVVDTCVVSQPASPLTSFDFNTSAQPVNSIGDYTDPTATGVDYEEVTGGVTSYVISDNKVTSTGTVAPFFDTAGSAHRVPNGVAYMFTYDGENYFFEENASINGAAISALGSYNSQGAGSYSQSFQIDLPSNSSDYPKWQRFGVRSNGEDAGSTWEDVIWIKSAPEDPLFSCIDVYSYFGIVTIVQLSPAQGGGMVYTMLGTSYFDTGAGNLPHVYHSGTFANEFANRKIFFNGATPTVVAGSIQYYENFGDLSVSTTSTPSWISTAPTFLAPNTGLNTSSDHATGVKFNGANNTSYSRGVSYELINEHGDKMRFMFRQVVAAAL